MRTFSILTRVVILAIVLMGCNLPKATDAPAPGAAFTSAAQTIVAQYTAEAAINPPIAAQPTDTPIPPPAEPTQTLAPTATPTPTDALTPTNIPDAIFEDDFSDTTGWYTIQEDDYGFQYTDGGYRIYNKLLNAAIWSVRYQEFANIRLEVDATREGGPEDGYFGVVCRFGNDGMDYYALVIGDNGFYGVLKMEDGKLEFLESATDEGDVIHRGKGETNRVRGVCSGEQLVLYANDHQLLEVFDDAFSKGDIGILAGNRMTSKGIDVLFDKFAILWP